MGDLGDIEAGVERVHRARAPSRGADIAFYVVTSLAPVLLIIVAIAGLVFGKTPYAAVW